MTNILINLALLLRAPFSRVFECAMDELAAAEMQANLEEI